MDDNGAHDELWQAAQRLESSADEAETQHARRALIAAARNLRLVAYAVLKTSERNPDR